MGKQFRHFENDDTVLDVQNTMRLRHGSNYTQVAESVISQLRTFHQSIPIASNRLDSSAPKLLLGLSGGIDSAVVASLAKSAVGIQNVLPVTMPARTDDAEALSRAALVRQHLGLVDPLLPYVVPIDSMVEAGVRAISSAMSRHQDQSHQDGVAEPMRRGNLAARARVAVLYDLSRVFGGRVLGTGIRAEYVQGHSTKFGTPFSYDFGVLDEFYKVDVYELGSLLGVPREVQAASPGPGFYQGHTHEHELGATVQEQDVCCYLLFGAKLRPEEVIKKYGVSETYVRELIARHRGSRHKRCLRVPYVKVSRDQLYT